MLEAVFRLTAEVETEWKIPLPVFFVIVINYIML